MVYLIIIAVLIIAAIIIRKKIKPYNLVFDVICIFCGGMGSGKTLNGVNRAIKKYNENCCIVKRKNKRIDLINDLRCIHNFITSIIYKIGLKFTDRPVKVPKYLDKKEHLQKPLLYSNIPIRIGRKNMSTELKVEHILLGRHIIDMSVVFIDEVSDFLGAWDYKNENLKSHGSVEEFFRLFRQYTHNGAIFMTDQNIDQIAKVVRNKIAFVYQLQGFRSIFGILGYTNVRHNAVSFDDSGVLNVSEGNFEDSTSKLFVWLLGRKKYDTFAYSDRYNTVPYQKELEYELKNFKTNHKLTLPTEKVESLTSK